jgi:hypothetical protein
MTRGQINRDWRLFHSVISSCATSSAVLGRQRTAYFYKTQALGWLRNMRRAWTQEMRETCRNLALIYWATFRKMKGAR